MKIKQKTLPYETVAALPKAPHYKPIKPSRLLGTVVRVLAIFDQIKTKFTYTEHRMEKLGKEPCLILMNHSCFLDLKLAYKLFYPRRFNIVSTTDGLIGWFGFKGKLMRWLGCVPTQKFVSDPSLITDMNYALKEKKASVLMYPEAGYSFDGRATVLPKRFGVLLKKLNVPVVTVITQGAFAYDPLYNNLQKRKVKVHADVTYLLTPEEIQEKSVEEIDALINEQFAFDAFKWQYENKIEITEDFRADGLNRILYKCPVCGAEGENEGKGTTLTCKKCGTVHELTTLGRMKAASGETKFAHIPDWYDWQRAEVRKEIETGKYLLDTDVSIAVLKDHKALYHVGEGRLVHNENGFTLTGCDGKLSYSQAPQSSYTLNSDYFWYEIGDIIAIGNADQLYYCFPKQRDVVTKARLAAEEMYTIYREKKLAARAERRAKRAAKAAE